MKSFGTSTIALHTRAVDYFLEMEIFVFKLSIDQVKEIDFSPLSLERVGPITHNRGSSVKIKLEGFLKNRTVEQVLKSLEELLCKLGTDIE